MFLKRQKEHQQKRTIDEQLMATLKDVYQKYQLLQKLETAAYDVPDDLYLLRKIEGAKYLCLLNEAKERHLVGDISLPKKARPVVLKKRTYQKDQLFSNS